MGMGAHVRATGSNGLPEYVGRSRPSFAPMPGAPPRARRTRGEERWRIAAECRECAAGPRVGPTGRAVGAETTARSRGAARRTSARQAARKDRTAEKARRKAERGRGSAVAAVGMSQTPRGCASCRDAEGGRGRNGSGSAAQRVPCGGAVSVPCSGRSAAELQQRRPREPLASARYGARRGGPHVAPCMAGPPDVDHRGAAGHASGNVGARK